VLAYNSLELKTEPGQDQMRKGIRTSYRGEKGENNETEMAFLVLKVSNKQRGQGGSEMGFSGRPERKN